MWPRQAQRGPTALFGPGVGPLQERLDSAGPSGQDRGDGDLDYVLLQGSDAGGGLSMVERMLGPVGDL
jgi:hypothetical protein